MSALGQKPTFALHAPCPLYPRKRTFAVHPRISAKGQKRTFAECRNGKTTSRWSLRNLFRCACHALEKRLLELHLRRISLACLRKPSATRVRVCFVETSGDDRARA